MTRWFRDLSVALKLNLILGVICLAVIAIATQWLSANVRQRLEDQAVQELEKTNALVVSICAAYDRSLTSDIERSGRLFAANFAGPIELVSTGNVPQLMLRGKAISEQTDVIDTFSSRSGTVATVFARQGEDFLRVATSVKKDDGSRATGTVLDAGHPARSAALAGKAYTGKARLFGKDYITHYAPVKDAGGKVVGIFFVGFDLTDGLKAVKQEILSIKIGTSGYVYALDAGVGKGTLTMHPTREGQNLATTKDANGRDVFREIIDAKTGVIRYRWADKDGQAPRDKIAAFTRFPAWDWAIVSSSYLDEFTQVASSVVGSIVIMAAAIMLAVAIASVWCVRRWVTQPLRKVMAETERIAGGDLSTQLAAQSNDELGRLTMSLSRMVEALKKTIANAHGASNTMLDHAHQLVAVAAQVTSSSQAQSDAATGMAASVEEMSVSISQVAQHARDAEQLSVSSGQTARQGGEVIGQAAGAMEKIVVTVRDAAATISTLGTHSQNISSVVAVIREIADQTNLLALNAAIEAARAGEHGRGFAVVADEVRKLAERTTVSTHSIGEMIASIQSGSEQATAHMKEAVNQVEQGSVLAEQARRAIDEIHASTGEVIAAVNSISAAINEQNAATQTIAQGVEGIAQKAEANHSATQSSAQSAQALREMAQLLDKDLGFFRVA